MSLRRPPLAALAAVLLSLTLTACGSSESDLEVEPIQPQTRSTPEVPGDAEAEGSDGEVPEQYAAPLAAIALAEQDSDGRAFEIDADDSGWEVLLDVGRDEVEVRISADGQEVLSSERDGSIDADDLAGLDAAQTGLAEAIGIGIGEHSGAGSTQLDDVTLDEEAGNAAWEVSFEDGTEVHVDVRNGNVLRVED